MRDFSSYTEHELARLWAPVAAREGRVQRLVYGGGEIAPVEKRAIAAREEANASLRALRDARNSAKCSTWTADGGRVWDADVLAVVTPEPQTSREIADKCGMGVMTVINSLRRLDAAGQVRRATLRDLTTCRLA